MKTKMSTYPLLFSVLSLFISIPNMNAQTADEFIPDEEPVLTDDGQMADRRSEIDRLNEKLESTDDLKEIIPIREKIADLHKANKNYLAAIEEFSKLQALATSNEEKAKYLLSSIAIKSYLAKWPLIPDWEFKPSEVPVDALQELYALYRQLIPLSPPKLKWRALAQAGLILLHFNKEGAALNLWSSNLIDGQPNKHKQYAVGIMLTRYSLQHDYAAILEVLEQAEKDAIKPIYERKFLNISSLKGEALLALATSAASKNDFKASNVYLHRFLKELPNDSRQNQVLPLLSNNYFNTQNVVLAVKYLQKFVTEYPDNPGTKSLLIKGIHSTKNSNQELSSKLCLLLLKNFDRGPAASVAREHLAKIFMKKQWYGDAARMYRLEAGDPDISKDQAVKAALAYMQIEGRYGDKEKAKWGAERIKQLAPNDQSIVALALSFEASFYAQQKNYAELSKISTTIERMDGKITEVRRAQSLIRHLMSQHNTKTNAKDDSVAASQKESMSQIYLTFIQQSKKFKIKCKKNPTSCPQANKERQQVARETIIKLSELPISPKDDIKSHRDYLIKQIKQQAL